jgi:hypothetical protein
LGKVTQRRQVEIVPPPGTRVRLQLGPYIYEGTVIEDRGDIGAGGRRLIRIAVQLDSNVMAEYELPLDRIEIVQSPA